jgi:hypothetical protein
MLRATDRNGPHTTQHGCHTRQSLDSKLAHSFHLENTLLNCLDLTSARRVSRDSLASRLKDLYRGKWEAANATP